jgi:hypothetical protein
VSSITDYTKHPEGLYEVVVQSHRMGESFGDDVFILTAEISGVKRSDGRIDGFLGEPKIEATFRLTTKMFWLFERLLATLGYQEDSLRYVYTEPDQPSSYFAGRVLTLQCKHFVNKDGTKKNEYWGLPDNRLSKISEDRMSTLDAMFAEARAKQQAVTAGYTATDSDLPF